MSAENFEDRWARREAERAGRVEVGGSTDDDQQGQRIDPIDPSLRLPPEGLFIDVDEESVVELFDPAWQEEWGRNERSLQLLPKLNGERCGTLYARFVVKRYSDRVDRYVHLGNVEVRGTRTQRNTRRQGIGSALLTEMEQYAERFGASRIEGIISPIDLKETPTLPTFYEKRGYQVTPRDAGYTIVKPL